MCLKLFLVIGCFVLFPAHADWAVHLRLRNGDSLRGDLLGMSGEGIRFRPQGMAGGISIGFAEVADLRGVHSVAGAEAPAHRLRLRAGGTLVASVEAEEETLYRLRFPWGQELGVPRDQVEDVESLEGIWRAPVAASGISIQANGMSYRRPELAEQGFDGLGVGRGWRAGFPLPSPLPERFVLEFDLAFPDAAVSEITLFSEKDIPGIFEGVQILIQGESVRVQWLDPEGRLVRQNFDLPAVGHQVWQLGLEVDLPAREFRLRVGENRLAPFPMRDFEIPGESWVLVNANPHPVRLRGLRMRSDDAEPTVLATPPTEGVGVRLACGGVWMGAEAVAVDQNVLVASVPGWTEPLRIPLEEVSVLSFDEVVPPEGNLTLANGDRLHGRLVAYENDDMVLETPWSEDPLRLPARTVKNWVSPQEPAEAEGESLLREVHFMDGSFLRGEVVGMDAEVFRFRAPWGQELSFPAEQVARLARVPPRVLLDGLADPEAWAFRSITLPERETPPRFEAGWLHFPGLSNQHMSLPLPELPLTFALEVELELRQDQPAYRLSLLPHAHSGSEEAFFELNFQGEGVMGRQGGGSAALSITWNEEAPDLGRWHAIRLYVDQQMGRITLFLNGRKMKEWPMVRGAGLGIHPGSLVRISTHPMQPMILRQLRIVEWNGHVPDLDFAGDPPFLILGNGDVLPMERATVEEGRMRVRQEDGRELNLPLDVVHDFHLRFRGLRPPALPEGHFLLRAPTAGVVMPIRPLRTEGDHLLAESPLTPDLLRIPTSMVQGLHAQGAR